MELNEQDKTISKPKVSVIVPVYKAEKYIHRCLGSLVNQTLHDIEIILVDDGSPDNSRKICDDYAAKDNRIKVIHKENGGVSSARNAGIKAATGEYSIHCDPDDWVELTAYEKLYNKAKETDADMVVCDYYAVTNGNVCVVCETDFCNDYKSAIEGMMLEKSGGGGYGIN